MTDKVTDNMNQLLNLGIDTDMDSDIGTPIEPRVYEPLAVDEIPSVLREFDLNELPDLARDYLYSRDVLHALIGKTNHAIGAMFTIASEGETPRAYEVFKELIDTNRQLNNDLMGLQKTYANIKKEIKEKPTGEKGVDGMTTSDLLDMIDTIDKDVKKSES